MDFDAKQIRGQEDAQTLDPTPLDAGSPSRLCTHPSPLDSSHSSPLLTLPPELLTLIALLTTPPNLAPPAGLLPLLRTSGLAGIPRCGPGAGLGAKFPGDSLASYPASDGLHGRVENPLVEAAHALRAHCVTLQTLARGIRTRLGLGTPSSPPTRCSCRNLGCRRRWLPCRRGWARCPRRCGRCTQHDDEWNGRGEGVGRTENSSHGRGHASLRCGSCGSSYMTGAMGRTRARRRTRRGAWAGRRTRCRARPRYGCSGFSRGGTRSALSPSPRAARSWRCCSRSSSHRFGTPHTLPPAPLLRAAPPEVASAAFGTGREAITVPTLHGPYPVYPLGRGWGGRYSDGSRDASSSSRESGRDVSASSRYSAGEEGAQDPEDTDDSPSSGSAPRRSHARVHLLDAATPAPIPHEFRQLGSSTPDLHPPAADNLEVTRRAADALAPTLHDIQEVPLDIRDTADEMSPATHARTPRTPFSPRPPRACSSSRACRPAGA
ncbi:hypothetical protein B0H17DRAFT_652061 [Mycena rosella]|uniref:Uncharacterized protein n=1 Tax=Mycena rosella TaxID=1033263 RepID=A0AAD7DCY6_MYCRO|nr:hypothetical protein B0H17DRAFT_652061 [Mycena rosella]